MTGAGVGFLSGLLANGGGFLLVPAYLVLCRLGIQEAAATYLGARVGLALRRHHARWLFALFLLAFGPFFLARTFYRAELYGWFT